MGCRILSRAQTAAEPIPDVLRSWCCFSQAAVFLAANNHLNRLRNGDAWLDLFGEPESFQLPTSLASFRGLKPSDKMLKEWGSDDTRMAELMKESWYMFHLVSLAKTGLITIGGERLFQDASIYGSTTGICYKTFIQAEKGLCQPKICQRYVRDVLKPVVEFAFDCKAVITTVPLLRPRTNVLDLPRPPPNLVPTSAEDYPRSWSSASSTPTAEKKKNFKMTTPRSDPPPKKSRVAVDSDDESD
jgi:hypothetical protein